MPEYSLFLGFSVFYSETHCMSEYAAACPGRYELIDGTKVIRASQVDGWAGPLRCVASGTPQLLPDKSDSRQIYELPKS